MSDGEKRLPNRDMNKSAFHEILARFESVCAGFEAVVFFDEEGEAIDYHSYLDPFDTRLAAAYHGVILSSAVHRYEWLKMGRVRRLDIVASNIETMTFGLGEGYGMTIVIKTGTMSDAMQFHIEDIISSLQKEAGLE